MAADVLDRLLITLAVRLHAFSVCAIQRGWRLRVSPSNAVIIHYVLAGTGSVRCGNGRWVPFAPRTVIIVPAHKPHDIGEPDRIVAEVRAEDHCTLLDDGLIKFTAGDGTADTLLVCGMISASYAGALGLFASLREPLVEDLSTSNVLQQAFDLMFAEIANPSFGTQAMAESLMKQCLILLLRHYLQRGDRVSPLLTALQDPRLARAVTEVLDNPAAPHSVESLAVKAGMSRASFAERFAQIYSQTPMEFVQKVRLRIAAGLLTTTDLAVKVISNSIGYTSRSSFSRAFRAVYGVDPKTFRQAGGQEERELEGIETLSVDVGSAADNTAEYR
jgi:AraC-like DNA-binding protein